MWLIRISSKRVLFISWLRWRLFLSYLAWRINDKPLRSWLLLICIILHRPECSAIISVVRHRKSLIYLRLGTSLLLLLPITAHNIIIVFSHINSFSSILVFSLVFFYLYIFIQLSLIQILSIQMGSLYLHI